MAAALAGIRVLDLTVWFQGPVSAQYLADFGAEVIKIERPQGGDQARGVRSIKSLEIGDWNQYFLVINRNKKSVALDLKTEGGREIMYRLVAESDVFLSNLEPQLLESWGLSYDKLKSIRPDIIYATNTG
ncbi:MAG: CoA transferase, partial [Proteobacteria bacterium]|nr:CoA transferase [Pseudomonadota bacterium]